MKIRGFFVYIFLIPILFFCSCKSNDREDFSREDIAKNIGQRNGLTDENIKIGSSLSLTGYIGRLGQGYLKGAQLYINKINRQGGVNGRKIDLIALDDGYNPSKTFLNTEMLINKEEVFALFNYVGTPTAVKIIDMINEEGIPLLGLLTGAEVLRNPVQPYIFNIRASYFSEVELALSYFVDTLNIENVAFFYQNDSFGRAILPGVQNSLKKRGIRLNNTGVYNRGELDIETAFERIYSKSPELVILVGTYAPLAKFINKSYQEGHYPYFYTVSFVGSEILSSIVKDGFVKTPESKEALKNIIVTEVVPSPYSLEYSCVREYRKELSSYFPEEPPSYISLEGYINAKVLIKALQQAGINLTRDSFIEALEDFRDYDLGIGEKINYDTDDHQGLNDAYYSRMNLEGDFIRFNP